ncbi:MAG: hypothetical protein R2777_06885 [Chitinophagales bacterium]
MNIKQEFSFKGNEITISNNNLQSVSFQFNINNEFPILVKKEIDSIYKISKTLSIDTPKAAWHYVIQNTFPSKAIYTKISRYLQYNIFINSTASGYCDDLSSHLVLLWEKLSWLE